MRTEVVQCGLAPPPPGLYSLYVNDMPTPSDHVQLPLIADDTYVTGTSQWPTLLVWRQLSRLELWLQDSRIAIDVSKSTAVLFVKTALRIQKHQRVQPVMVPIEHGVVGWSSVHNWPNETTQIRSEGRLHRDWMQSRLLERSGLSIRQCYSYKRLIRPMMEYAYPIWRSAASTHVRKSQVLKCKRTLVSTDS